MDRTVSKTTNMTKGDPVRIILTLAVPLFIGNIFQQVYSLVDTMIAGHFLGDGAIAAIGATGVLYSLFCAAPCRPWGIRCCLCSPAPLN